MQFLEEHVESEGALPVVGNLGPFSKGPQKAGGGPSPYGLEVDMRDIKTQTPKVKESWSLENKGCSLKQPEYPQPV